MTHHEPSYYYDLEQQIEIQTRKRDELLEIAAQEQLFQAEDFKARGYMLGDDIAARYREAAADLTKVIDAYKEKLPCDAFIVRFGYWLHEEYREHYPINRKTLLVNAPYNGVSVRYVIPPPMALFSGYDISAPGPVMPTVDIREARWERWRDQRDDVPMLAFAFNADENIVYIAIDGND